MIRRSSPQIRNPQSAIRNWPVRNPQSAIRNRQMADETNWRILILFTLSLLLLVDGCRQINQMPPASRLGSEAVISNQ